MHIRRLIFKVSFLTLSMYILTCITACVHVGKGTSNLQQVDTTSLMDLMSLKQPPKSKKKKASTGIRYQAIKEGALSVGAQGGLAHRSRAINKVLATQRKSLDRAFDFNGMLLDHSVLPPVLVEGDHTLNLDSDDTIRVADKTYSLVSQARFVTTVPLWSDYLWMNFTRPAVPDSSLLPRDAEEDKIWQENVLIGWKKGLAQAESIYESNVARLKRDYEGMALYRELLAKNMISPPFVAKTDLGVTGGGENLTVNDRIFRITAKPQLNPNTRNWKPIVQQ